MEVSRPVLSSFNANNAEVEGPFLTLTLTGQGDSSANGEAADAETSEEAANSE